MADSMKKLEFYLNVIHYCMYKLMNKLIIFISSLVVYITLKLNFDRILRRRGLDYIEQQNKALYPYINRYGLNVAHAGGLLTGFFGMFFFGVFLIIFELFVSIGSLSATYLIPAALLAIFTVRYFITKKDKYIKYFDEFEKWSRREKYKYGLIAFFSLFLLQFTFFFPMLFKLRGIF